MNEPAEPTLWPAPRPVRFPYFWLGGLAAVWLAFEAAPITRDYQVVVGQVCTGAALIGLLTWYALRGGRRRRRRVALGTIAVVLVAVVGIRLQTDGDGRVVGWRFRWTPLPDRTLELPIAEGSKTTDPLAVSSIEYPAFLGGAFWAEVPDTRLADDWQAHPPQEVWRRPVGAGWSAFAVAGGLAVTQEQRGEQELVVAYRLEDGSVAWWHGDDARFDPFGPTQRMGGVGPRATPTLHAGRVYTHGATGIVNCLDLQSGERRWRRDTLAEFDADNLMWGKSGSPVVMPEAGVVLIGVGATTDDPNVGASLVAFDLNTGETRWQGGGRAAAYATPVVADLAGKRQVLQVNQDFLTAHDAENGAVLWEIEWPGNNSFDASCSQPIPLPGDQVFLSKGYGLGSVLLQVAVDQDGTLSAEPVWQNNVMKTKFGNVVLRDGFVYGLDGVLLQCVDLQTGQSLWKKRRRPPFDHGQIMLVGDHLLILTEWGELVLADVSPEGYTEKASLQALNQDGPTWNNPTLAGPFLLVRNATEAVCYRLTLEEEKTLTPERSPATSPQE